MLQFNTLILHNFGSYNHAEVDLQNKGFCLVTGENHHRKDNALSNGSGKSFIFNAICYALTGQTINGTSKNLKNKYNLDEEMYVQLEFNYNGHFYSIKRGEK